VRARFRELWQHAAPKFATGEGAVYLGRTIAVSGKCRSAAAALTCASASTRGTERLEGGQVRIESSFGPKRSIRSPTADIRTIARYVRERLGRD